MKQSRVFLFALYLFSSLALAAEPPKPATAPATQPATYTVKKGSLSLDVSLEGIFQPADPFEVKFKLKNYNGPLTVVKAAAPFAQVKQGDALLEIDPQHMNWAVQGAENEAENARAAYKKAQADAELSEKADALALRMQQDATKNAVSALAWWEKMDGPQMLLSADLMLQQVKYGVEDQNDELEQLRKMYGAEELNKPTADIVIKRAIRRLDLMKKNLSMQEERTDKLKTNEYPIAKQRVLDSLAQSRGALASLEVAQAHTAVVRKTGLSNSLIALQQAEQKLKEIKADAAALTVTAPYSGMVIYGNVQDGQWQGGDPKALKPGEKLAPGAIVMRVARPGQLQIETTVPENRALWIEPGCKAKVTPAALPYVSYEATCSPVVAEPRGNPPAFGFAITVTIANADARVLPGMHASIKIEAPKGEQMLVVPASAISGDTVTLKTKDGKTEKRTVTVGRSDGNLVEIRSGLVEGDEILLTSGK